MSGDWQLALCAGASVMLMKALPFLFPPSQQRSTRLAMLADRVPAAMFGALIANAVFVEGRSLVVDERAAGLVTAALLVWMRAPASVTLAAAVLMTAMLRGVTQ